MSQRLGQLLEQSSTIVQTLIFSKEIFKTAEEAKRWAAAHGFKNAKVDETGESFRLRQRPPGAFADGSFHTIELTDGLKAVIGKLKEARRLFHESTTGRLCELKDDEGKAWEAVIIQTGLSKNNRLYTDDVLLKSAKLFEGAQCYAYEFQGNYLDHLPDDAKAALPEGFARNLVGWFDHVRFDEFMGADGKAHTGLLATFHCTDDRIRDTFLRAWREGKRDLLGFSIDVDGRIERLWSEGQLIDKVEAIEHVTSVDVVSVPAAGGQVLRLVASQGGGAMKEKLVALIQQYNPQLLEGLDPAAITEEQAWALLGQLLDGLTAAAQDTVDEAQKKKKQEMTETLLAAIVGGMSNLKELLQHDEGLLEKALAYLREHRVDDAIALLQGLIAQRKQPAAHEQPPATTQETAADVKAALAKAQAAELEAKHATEQLAILQSNQALTESLAQETALPAPIKQRLDKRFRGRVFEAAELQTALTEEKELLGALVQSGEVDGLGAQAKVGLQESDRLQSALDLMLGYAPTEAQKAQYDGVKPFRSLREAFYAFHKYPIEEDGHLTEAMLRRVKEATTADFAFALGTSMTRKLVKEYRRLPYDWQKFATVVPIDNFKQQERIRWGGLGVLPTIAESTTADYPDLTFPTDERAIYTPSKRGGIIPITREMILNDDLAVLRRLPNRIAVAANRMLNRFVFDLLLNVDSAGAINAGTIYDTLALYHANHLNLLTVALSYANLVTARQRLFAMPEYGTKDQLNGAIDDAVTTVTVDNGAKFKANDYIQVDAEIMLVTLVTVNDLTVVRAQFGTAAAAHADNAIVYQITEPQLGLQMKYLVVPIELENTARLIRDSERVPGSNFNDVNTLRGSFEVITSPFLRGDTNNWYVTADPDQLDLIEVGFVEGREDPVILLQDQPNIGNVFARDTIRYKVRHEYGGAVIDFRGFVGSLVA